MSNKKYWKGYDEKKETASFVKSKHNEFPQDIPVLKEIKNVVSEATSGNRRDFLKMLGFSLGAATIAASCEIPIKKAIPYIHKPEEITPGIANYYASSFVNGSDYCSVLVKTREGRPIKIEGNDLSGISRGGTSARAQASLLSLYDSARLRGPRLDGKKAKWANVDEEIAAACARGNTIVLTSSIVSPSLQAAIDEFRNKFGATHIIYEPASNAGMLEANQASFGKKVIPSYQFNKANVIVSLGADFLGTWVSPVEFATQYGEARKLSLDNKKAHLNKHWQFESYMSMTGANADQRFTIKPSEEGTVALALYAALGGGGGGGKLSNAAASKAIQECANDLKKAGSSIVVSGSNDPNVQMIVNSINDMLGNYGNTIHLDTPYNVHQGDDSAMDKLVNDMNSGRVNNLIMYNVNPAYSYPKADQFLAGLKKVATTVSMNDREDETGENVKYLCPASHYLESWGDAEPKKGFYSLMQPTIAPLFDTRSAIETFLKWSGNNTSDYDFIRQTWQRLGSNSSLGFQAFWDAALHDGVFELNNPGKTKGNAVSAMYAASGVSAASFAQEEEDTPTSTEQQVQHTEEGEGSVGSSSISVSSAISAINTGSKGGSIELKLYENALMGDGRYANNPFLHETPEPVSKVCWENVASVAPGFAKEQGWDEFDIIEITANGHTVKLPVIYQPGLAHGTIAVALGYGRTKAGHPYCNVGANVYPFVKFNGKTLDYNVLKGVTVNKVGKNYELALTQTHHTIDDTGVGDNERYIVLETTLDEYKNDEWAGNEYTKNINAHKDELFFTLYGKDKEYGPHKDLFEMGHHWGMTVDLSACIGCGACVTACNIENNVPVVGKEEVFRAHEMHWMRIDRYYSGDDENPDVTFMPMLCQHCDNAPCENVCPVNATNHSSEGINQMAYNRCIGTRYCANNCPFKVRRFNWYDYQGADSFYKHSIFDNDYWQLNDDLTRMVLNPDVSVRSRGVMEKCSFCVQRIQEGKLEAKKAGRKLKDGEIKVACQTACPTNAIVFGDMNDKESEVSKRMENSRTYKLLEEIHVLPSIGYMVQVRNRKADPSAKKDHHQHTKDEHHG